MKPTQSIAAVIFDLDGLMIDSEEISYQIVQEYAAEFNITFTREDYSHLVGRDTESSGEYLRDEIGIPLPPEKIMRDHWDRLTDLIIHQSRPMPGLLDLLDEVAKRQIPMGVASNSGIPYVEHALKALGVRDAFQCVFSGQDCARAKPAPDVYLQAASCLKVQPEKCLAFEDSPPGFQSAYAAGMRCIVVPHQGLINASFDGAFARFDSLTQAVANLDQLMA